MSANIINGKELAKHRESLLRNKVEHFIKLNRRKPSLLAIELSADPGSKLYLKLKQAAADRIGIEMKVEKCPKGSDLSEDLILSDSDGIFIQHPPGYDKQKWQELADQIPPEKDVDYLTGENLNLIKQGKPRFLPATVKAVLYCLENAFCSSSSEAQSRDPASKASDVRIASLDSSTPLRSARNDGLKYVILGRSPILGLPLSWYLKNLGADVTLLHSQTENNEQKTMIKKADVIISATGKPRFITGAMVKYGVIAIDCASPVGDIDFASVSQKAAAITPVPGGVGPLTVVSLMENVVKSAYHADREGS